MRLRPSLSVSVPVVGALSNRLAGRAALHPTPGSPGSLQLASDLLVSLGKRFDALAFECARTRAWELVEIWMAAERVRHLFVLRGHLLAAGRWRELLEPARRGGRSVVRFPWAPAHGGGVVARDHVVPAVGPVLLRRPLG